MSDMPKTILITGASSGIGLATAKRFAREGWNVVATMRSSTDGAELAKLGDHVLVTRLDVQDLASIDAAVTAVTAGIARFGTIDVLVNNAGFGLMGVFESLSREQIRQQFDVNVIGVMDVTRAVLPQMRKQKSGVIINVSSRAGIIAQPMISLYSASKFALEGFSEALSFELAAVGIAVKIIQPSGGITSTKFGDRTAREAQPLTPPADYAAFVDATRTTFAKMMTAAKTDTPDVAEVIFTAATDGTDKLRYFVGVDNPPLIKARREMTEEEYIRFVRATYYGGSPRFITSRTK
jgi:NAD(P)-dependent dehydrogenase (short-subunit alcohol dehydrogenase family)